MKTSGIRTPRLPKASTAAAAALTVTLLLAVPGATNAAPVDTPALPGWVAGGQLAPGVERMHLRDDSSTADPKKPRKAPRELTVIRIDPTVASLRIESTTGKVGGTAETVRNQLGSQPRKPFAAINGSYFMLEGRTKDRALESSQSFGATVRDGELMGAACIMSSSPRSSLILQHGVPRIANVSTVMTVAQKGVPGTSFTLDDVNRVPGTPMACQREAEDGVLKDGVRKAVKYTDVHGKPVAVWPDATEFVLFNDSYGIPTPPKGTNNNDSTDPNSAVTGTNVVTADDQDGYEVEVDATGTITNKWDVRGNRTVRKGYRNLQAIGTAEVNWLKSMAVGTTLDIAQNLKDVDLDQAIPLDESVDVVAGGAILMKDGVDKNAPDGCSRPDPATPTEGVTQICRSSRTVVGVDQQGRTLLLTVTGPLAPSDPADKVDGAWFTEVTQVLKSLGAMDAINLDGGGSTTLLTRPIAEDTLVRETGVSDTTGERAVFDTVYSGPGGYAVPKKTS